MKMAIVRQVLLAELDREFGDYGFKRRSSKFHGDAYERTLADLTRVIRVPIRSRVVWLELGTPFVSVRHDAAEELVFRFDKELEILPMTSYKDRNTLGRSLEFGVLPSIWPRTWDVEDNESAIKAASEYVPKVMKEATPFWSLYGDQEAILAQLMATDEKSLELAGPHQFRAKKAVALTWLLRGQPKARELANAELSRLQGEERNAFQNWLNRAFA